MWRIGNALTDLVRNPCLIVFYGASGEERKSVLATNISRVLEKGVEWTVTDLIRKTSKWPDAQTVMNLAEKRLIICDECGIEEDMNYNNIKRWTSNALVQSGGMFAHLCQTIIGISNKMDFAVKPAINYSIGRRVVIYKMDKELGRLKPVPAQAVNVCVKMQFISAYLSISAMYERAPMSLEIALYTVFRRSVNFITAAIKIDYTAPPHHCIVSTAIIATRIGVTIDRLVQCFAAMSNRLVCIPKYGTGFIFGLRYERKLLTKFG
ncbi:FAD-binding, type 2 [Teratosphaeria destructans]|uniref:FAD-binding, type 2 n=1 Tax=Teratosphaeria destructans TaxID=418781 RepID=A0A9W7W2K7_9PEZI|nr:FAD-binding, type 2 [Teratosphaeria destructans]